MVCPWVSSRSALLKRGEPQGRPLAPAVVFQLGRTIDAIAESGERFGQWGPLLIPQAFLTSLTTLQDSMEAGRPAGGGRRGTASKRPRWLCCSRRYLLTLFARRVAAACTRTLGRPVLKYCAVNLDREHQPCRKQTKKLGSTRCLPFRNRRNRPPWRLLPRSERQTTSIDAERATRQLRW